MKDIRITKTNCHLTIPVFEKKTKIELLIHDARIEEYEEHEQIYVLYYNITYYYDSITDDKDILEMNTMAGYPVKKECFQKTIERSIYKILHQILRYFSSDMWNDFDRLPSTCGFFCWHTFQKLLPWIRENWDFSFCVEGVAEDGALIRAEYADDIYRVYAQDKYLGSIRIYPGGSSEWWEDDLKLFQDHDISLNDPANIYTIGGGAEDFSQELTVIEHFYQSKQLITPSIENALTDYRHEKKLSMADEKVIAMYYYYPNPCDGPLQYYIIKGKKCGENSWRLYGLIDNTIEWFWGEILIGECSEEIPAFPLPPRTMRKTEVSGQRLKDVLKQYGRLGWEEYL